VAWIAERKDVLSGFFALLTLLNYAQFAKNNDRKALWLALIFFALGLMAKPMLVTLPFVLLLLDFWPLQRLTWQTRWPDLVSVKRLFQEKWAFLGLTVVSCFITYSAQSHGAVASLKNIPLGYRLENAPIAVVTYLEKTTWPESMAVIYPMPDVISAASVALSVFVLAVLTIFAWFLRHRQPFILMGWLWFLGMLVPVIGVVKVGDAAFADRYTYLPSIGFFIAIVFGIEAWLSKVRIPQSAISSAWAAILLALVVVTEHQLSFWRDDETLFGHALAVTKDNPDADINYGVALEKTGRQHEALESYRRAEKLVPASVHVHNNLGNLLDNMGRPAEAFPEYQEAVRLSPNRAELHDGLGDTLTQLGRWPEAMAEFEKAAQLNPINPWPHFQIAKALLKRGQDVNAMDEFQEALRLSPDNFEILAYMAHVLASTTNGQTRNGVEALKLANKANTLTGGLQPFVLDALAMAFAETGDFTNAIQTAQSAINTATAAGVTNIEPLKQRLDLYRNRQPWRESFLSTNPPGNEVEFK